MLLWINRCKNDIILKLNDKCCWREHLLCFVTHFVAPKSLVLVLVAVSFTPSISPLLLITVTQWYNSKTKYWKYWKLGSKNVRSYHEASSWRVKWTLHSWIIIGVNKIQIFFLCKIWRMRFCCVLVRTNLLLSIDWITSKT